jgi:hypothetical protein
VRNGFENLLAYRKKWLYIGLNIRYNRSMKHQKLIILFIISMITSGCANTMGIIHRSYNYEKIFFGTHQIEFDIILENIDNSGEISNLIKALIYNNMDFDEYVKSIEIDFIGDAREDYYPQILLDDGTKYFYKSYLTKEYSVEYYSDSFVIIKYFNYFYKSGAAHGNYWVEYYIIDLAEKRMLEINDLLNQIPDGILKQIIESKYEISGDYLRENIFPPDTINFCNDNIELIWNTYQILPYVFGFISIEIQEDIIQQYLTDKGIILKSQIDKAK